jgi:hypothetical protein
VSPHRLPGWTLANGHIVRSHAEAALCEALERNGLAHAHWALNFEVPAGTDHLRLYTPSIVLTETKKDARTILVEAMDSVHPGSGLRRMEALRTWQGDRYFLIIVARRPLHHRFPPDSYDALFPLEDFRPLLDFLRGLPPSPAP